MLLLKVIVVDYGQREGEITRAGRKIWASTKEKGFTSWFVFGVSISPSLMERSLLLWDNRHWLVSTGLAHHAFLPPFLCLWGTPFQFWESGWRCQSRCLSLWLQEEGFLVRKELEPVGATEKVSLFRLLWCSLGAIVSYLYHMEQSLSKAEKKLCYPIEIQREAKLNVCVGRGVPILCMCLHLTIPAVHWMWPLCGSIYSLFQQDFCHRELKYFWLIQLANWNRSPL